MAGFTPFTDNYTDLSDHNGYQFEFRCDICGSGYRSEFKRSGLGTASTLLSGASSLVGGLFGGASNAAYQAKNIADRGARDDALKAAANEIMPLFTRCTRSSHWVDWTCWNEARGLCVSCAPKLAGDPAVRHLLHGEGLGRFVDRQSQIVCPLPDVEISEVHGQAS